MSWEEIDSQMPDNLAEGFRWQALVAFRLMQEGFGVRVEPLRVRPSYGQASEYADVTDILVKAAGSSTERMVEVKSRSLHFTSPEDFPKAEPFVDTVSAFDRHAEMPYAYVFVSQQTRAMVAVHVRTTRPTWKIIAKADGGRGFPQRYYACKRSDLRPFGALVDALRKSALPCGP